MFPDQPGNLSVGDLAGAEGLHHQRDGVRNPDRVSDLKLAPVSEPDATTFFAT